MVNVHAPNYSVLKGLRILDLGIVFVVVSGQEPGVFSYCVLSLLITIHHAEIL